MIKERQLITWLLSLVFIFIAGLAQADEPQRTELEQVVISASRTEQKVQDAISQVYVITADDIKQRQIKNVQGLLREIPGVRITEITGSWGQGGNVQLMGMKPSQTLILVDGQRFMGGHGSVDISSIPVENIERIEVVKGPGSALYGADAMAGVIHIITRKAEPTTSFNTGLSFGSRDRIVGNVGVNAGTERMGTLVNYTGKYTTGVDKDEDTVGNHAFSGSVHYQPLESTILRIQPFFSRQNNKVKGQADRIQKRTSFNASADIWPANRSHVQVRGSYFSHDHTLKDKSLDIFRTLQEFETVYSTFLGSHHLSIGYAFQRESVDDKHKNYTRDTQSIHGIYLQNEIDLNCLTFTLGGRFDYHDEWGTEFHPRGGIVFKASEKLRFRASAGTAFVAPTLLSLYADNWRMGQWTRFANPDLKPEKSLSYQAGFDFQPHSSFLIRSSFFRNEIDNLIKTVRVDRNMFYRNVSEAVTQGVENSIVWHPFRAFRASLGYTYTETEDKETGKNLTDHPKHLTSLNLDYYLQEPDIRFHLAGLYTGKRTYEENNMTKTRNSFPLIDLTITYYLTEKLEFFTRLENLTNEKNIGDEPDIDGIEWMLGVGFKF